VNGLALDVRLAARALLKARSVTLPAVLTLALAIGANAAVFSLVNSLLLRPLPVADPDRLASVTSEFSIDHGFTSGAGWSYRMWESLQQRAAAFDGVLAWTPQRFTLGAAGDAEPVTALLASGEFFSTLGVHPRIGRLFGVDDDRAGAPVAVISHRLWMRRFGGAASVVGSPLVVDGAQVTIVGVAPEAFLGLEVGKPFDVALPIGAEAVLRGRTAMIRSGRFFGLLVLVRLKPQQTLASATDALRALQSEIVPPNAPAFVKEPFVLIAADGTASGPASPRHAFRRPILVMLGGVALVLAIACGNIANLLLARAIARRRELGMRLALGATRWRLVRPMVIESVFLAAAGGAVGLLVAAWGARALVSLSPIVLDLPLDWRVMSFTAAAALVAGLASGFLAAHRAAGASASEVLKGTSGPGTARTPLANALVIAQIALALLVIVSAALFVRTLTSLVRRPLGFDAGRVLIVRAGLARVAGDPASRWRLYQQLADAARAVPGAAAAAASIWTPLSGDGRVIGFPRPGAAAADQRVDILANFVSPGWFATYGTPLEAGRDFGDQDGPASQKVVLVNRAFVRRFLAEVQAVGATYSGSLIVGVVGDAVYRTSQLVPGVTSLAMREPVSPTIYAPLAQAALWDNPPVTSIRISVRSSAGSPRTLVRSVGAALAGVEPNLVLEFRPLSDEVDASLAQERMSATASSFFGVLSLLLATLGIYGVTSYTVSRSTSEIGVRLALGATREGIIRLFLTRALKTAVAGLLIGLAAAIVATRSLSSLLFGIAPLDPVTLIAVSLLLVLVVLAAALIPARRASRINPWVSLRAD
jgi:putative ABC transport system permease protein